MLPVYWAITRIISYFLGDCIASPANDVENTLCLTLLSLMCLAIQLAFSIRAKSEENLAD